MGGGGGDGRATGLGGGDFLRGGGGDFLSGGFLGGGGDFLGRGDLGGGFFAFLASATSDRKEHPIMSSTTNNVLFILIKSLI